MHNYRNLQVYSKSLDLITHVYQATRTFPKEELFGLTSQVRRAAVSIALNIAEGSGNSSRKEFIRFLEMALRSTYEVMTCLELALRLGFLSKSGLDSIMPLGDQVAAMLVGFMKTLKGEMRIATKPG